MNIPRRSPNPVAADFRQRNSRKAAPTDVGGYDVLKVVPWGPLGMTLVVFVCALAARAAESGLAAAQVKPAVLAQAMDRLFDMTRLAGTPLTVMRAHWPWQVYERNRNLRGEVADWYTLEGPLVVKRDGGYYCFFSGGNYQNDSYGVDYLVADNVHGPWTELGRERGPQIVRSVPDNVFGLGHNSIVSSPDGQRDFLVYHDWNPGRTARQMWVDPLIWTPEGPRVERFQERIAEMNRKAKVVR